MSGEKLVAISDGNNSIHSSRLQRKHSRFKTKLESSTQSKTCKNPMPFLEKMYWDESSQLETAATADINDDYFHFENMDVCTFVQEQMLSAADYCERTSTEVKPVDLFGETNKANKHLERIAETNNVSTGDVHIDSNQFEVTDTELLNVCQTYEKANKFAVKGSQCTSGASPNKTSRKKLFLPDEVDDSSSDCGSSLEDASMSSDSMDGISYLPMNFGDTSFLINSLKKLSQSFSECQNKTAINCEETDELALKKTCCDSSDLQLSKNLLQLKQKPMHLGYYKDNEDFCGFDCNCCSHHSHTIDLPETKEPSNKQFNKSQYNTERDLFDDGGLDDNFFQNFKTQTNNRLATSYAKVSCQSAFEENTDVAFNKSTTRMSKEFLKEPSNANSFVGFKTASKKIITISDKTKQKAIQIIKECMNESLDHNLEKNTANDHIIVKSANENLPKSDVHKTKNCMELMGFQTASKKNIEISEKVVNQAALLIKQFTNEPFNQEIDIDEADDFNFEVRNTKGKTVRAETNPIGSTYEDSTKLNGKAELLKNATNDNTEYIKEFLNESVENELLEFISKENKCSKPVNKYTHTHTNNKNKCTKGNMVLGFQTASKKSIEMPENFIKRAEHLVNQLTKEECNQELNNKETLISETELEENKHLDMQQTLHYCEKEHANTCVVNKTIESSRDVNENVEQYLINEFMNESSDYELLEMIDNENGTSKTLSESTSNVKFGGFQTASKKQIVVSEKFLNQATALVREVINESFNKKLEFNEVLEPKNENSVDKTHETIPDCYKESTNENIITNECDEPLQLLHKKELAGKAIHSRNGNHLNNANKNINQNEINSPEIMNLLHIESLQEEIKDNLNTLSLKRRHCEMSNNSLECVSKHICLSNSPNSQKNVQSRNQEMSSQPENVTDTLIATPSSSFINRKNLLSLNHFRKTRVDKKEHEKSNETFKSSVKNCNIISTSTPNKPDPSSFFNSVLHTSTPTGAKTERIADNSIISSNKRTSSVKYNGFFGDNVTFKSTNPSPKERIGRLHVYGKPPALSPILMNNNNNCRPSGLKRSLRKKKFF